MLMNLPGIQIIFDSMVSRGQSTVHIIMNQSLSNAVEDGLAGNIPILGPPKSNVGIRNVPINETLLDMRNVKLWHELAVATN